MKASERLRALEATDGLGNKFQTYPQQQALYEALPFIADVVEAAEDAADHFIDQSAHDHIWPIGLKDALTALQDALQEDMNTVGGGQIGCG